MKTYTFTAECWPDVLNFRRQLPIGSTNPLNCKFGKNFTDVDVIIKTTLTLEELKDIIGQVENGHKMLRTLKERSKSKMKVTLILETNESVEQVKQHFEKQFKNVTVKEGDM